MQGRTTPILIFTPGRPAHFRHHGRVVKAPDPKSGGLCPRRFESGWCRLVFSKAIFSPQHVRPAHGIGRVRRSLPPWRNGYRVPLLRERLRVRIPQGVYSHILFTAMKATHTIYKPGVISRWESLPGCPRGPRG